MSSNIWSAIIECPNCGNKHYPTAGDDEYVDMYGGECELKHACISCGEVYVMTGVQATVWKTRLADSGGA